MCLEAILWVGEKQAVRVSFTSVATVKTAGIQSAR